ncbi:L-histidine N(alpha)-methyltransferase [Croceivirga sp. JEA036]|uniref:L-histidine N(alpha)-methyltransferase n=1 Tax=Croceivirga sp. JEA036 TaxID=2721162 RepID=UPI00143A85AF|nr:L-histidine N(alpha)-methyltransferase [Croceivirga sp. JEA036]NJB36158.1 L-histidine N(alpha)-methyltransferase [Croceivirga sp. JEA036]
MEKTTTPKTNTVFAREVKEGLSSYPKHLSSKYFYDEIGDKLFQQIMALPEYYLTRAEYAIFEQHKTEITASFSAPHVPFNLYELGAGDGTKTKLLLKELLAQNYQFEYRPIDISANALAQLSTSLTNELPNVSVQPIQGTYFDSLKEMGQTQEKKKVILFLGSNIGNLNHKLALEFLMNIAHILNKDDLFFMGMDQKKHPRTILNAYSDPSGITAAFNKNVLTRINNELGGNFNLDNFIHWESYNPETGTAKSYLVSKIAQEVTIEALEQSFEFDAWETIHTEISQKYDDAMVHQMAEDAGLRVVNQFTDANSTFKNYLFTIA